LDPGEEFCAVVGFAALVFFNNEEGRFFNPLVGGESAAAGQAFAPAADQGFIAGTARINDFIFVFFAGRTTHGFKRYLLEEFFIERKFFREGFDVLSNRRELCFIRLIRKRPID
jgi:hypothetical protein